MDWEALFAKHAGPPPPRQRRSKLDLGSTDMNRSVDSRPTPRPLSSTRAAGPPSVSSGPGVQRIPSAELFTAGAVVEIEHEGEIYRLRRTRKGKLILTK